MAHEVHPDNRSAGSGDCLDRPLYLLGQLGRLEVPFRTSRLRHVARLIFEGNHLIGPPGSAPSEKIDRSGQGRPMEIGRRDGLDLLTPLPVPGMGSPKPDPDLLDQLVNVRPRKAKSRRDMPKNAGEIAEHVLQRW